MNKELWMNPKQASAEGYFATGSLYQTFEAAEQSIEMDQLLSHGFQTVIVDNYLSSDCRRYVELFANSEQYSIWFRHPQT